MLICMNLELDMGQLSLNLHKKPLVSIKTGKNAELKPIIVSGKVEKVAVLSQGTEYNAAPDLVVNGDGVGAVLRAVVSNGSVTDVVVINSGSGYTQEKTTISAKPPGLNGLIDVDVRPLTLNNQYRFGDEILYSSGSGLQYGVVGYSTAYRK